MTLLQRCGWCHVEYPSDLLSTNFVHQPNPGPQYYVGLWHSVWPMCGLCGLRILQQIEHREMDALPIVSHEQQRQAAALWRYSVSDKLG